MKCKLWLLVFVFSALITNSLYAKSADDVITDAIKSAYELANDPKVGYNNDNSKKSSRPNDVNCGGFVEKAYVMAGVSDLGNAGLSCVGELYLKWVNFGFKVVTDEVDFKTQKGLKPGDVLLWFTVDDKGNPTTPSHTEIYVKKDLTIGARGDTDGKPGESTPGSEMGEGSYSMLADKWMQVVRFVGEGAENNEESETESRGTVQLNGNANWVTAEDEIPGMDGRVFRVSDGQGTIDLPDSSSVSERGQQESLEYVRDEMISSKNVNLFKVIQICITIIGLFLLIYITLLWVSYIFDSVNTLVDVSLIGVLTLGKYRVTGMHEDEDKHEMTPQRLLIVSFITFSVSLGIFSGFIYFLIQSVMNIISGLI